MTNNLKFVWLLAQVYVMSSITITFIFPFHGLDLEDRPKGHSWKISSSKFPCRVIQFPYQRCDTKQYAKTHIFWNGTKDTGEIFFYHLRIFTCHKSSPDCSITFNVKDSLTFNSSPSHGHWRSKYFYPYNHCLLFSNSFPMASCQLLLWNGSGWLHASWNVIGIWNVSLQDGGSMRFNFFSVHNSFWSLFTW